MKEILLFNMVLLVFLFFIISSLIFFVNTAIQVTFVNKLVRNTRLNLLEKYIDKDLLFHKNTNSVHLISKMFTQIDEASQLTFYGYFDFLNRISSSIIFISLLTLYNFKISILAFVTLLIFYFIIDFFIKKNKQNFKRFVPIKSKIFIICCGDYKII